MSNLLWLSLSPCLSRFDQPLLRQLAPRGGVSHWAYHQSPDEPCDWQGAVILLQEYLKHQDQPVHLIGHGVSGVVGWLYGQQYPQFVRSLTLLSVAPNPAITWHVHYYQLRSRLPCGRSRILSQLVSALFGPLPRPQHQGIQDLLRQDLDNQFTPHSLMGLSPLPGSHPLVRPPVPLFIGHGEWDGLTSPGERQGWQERLTNRDRQWVCPQGRHFFHHSHAPSLALALQQFWHALDHPPSPVAQSTSFPASR